MLASALHILFVILFINEVKNGATVNLLVSTPVGLIEGQQATDGDYSMFLGIPYAYVNESNPFGVSLPYPYMENIFVANDDTAECPQLRDGELTGTLDCLHVNVYVPNTASNQNRLPVMVWIHGGSFQRGGGGRRVYGPKYLAAHDIILVTMNYRLGPYGFMCLDIPEVPGNQGLKDTLMALRWVRRNIESFGGDVDSITLAGASAGARAVDFHLTSQQEHLFDRVILQSAASVSPPGVTLPNSTFTLQLAAYLGLETNDVLEALYFLNTVDTNVLVEATYSLNIISEFKPCIESDFENVEKFIYDHTYNLDLPKVRNMPILLGVTKNERMLYYLNRNTTFNDNLNVLREMLGNYFEFNPNQDRLEELVTRFYIGEEGMSINVWDTIDFDSDFTYNHPILRTKDKYLANGSGNIFFYVFSYDGGRNLGKIMRNVTEVPGVAHSDDIGYLFRVSNIPEPATPEDQLIIDRMTTLWTNFVKYGNPTPTISNVLPVRWIPVTKEYLPYYNIDSELNVGNRPFNDRMAFWDLIFAQYGIYQRVSQKTESSV